MSSYQEFLDTSGSEAVRGFLHPAAVAGATGSDCLILTHGAGANCQAPLLVALADAFSASGLNVLRCDLPFRQERPHGPPIRTAERDQAGLRAAVEAMRRMPGPHAPARVFLGGHSYGGRQASMLAAAEPGLVDGLLLLSYPLHPPKRPQQMRTQHFASLKTPALFVSGVRDGFGTIPEMEAALRLIPARTELLPIQAAGHELLTKRNGEELVRLVVEEFREFTGI
jgi:predicted alpha/beta-hydrolase family hydrolase